MNGSIIKISSFKKKQYSLIYLLEEIIHKLMY